MPKALKADLHTHSSEDRYEPFIAYSARQLIDRAAQLGYDVLGLTLHRRLWAPAVLIDYAAAKGILLLPGVEARIEGRDVLLYNISPGELAALRSFEDLAALKATKPELLVLAPHPFYPSKHSLLGKLANYHELFDGIEWSSFWCISWLNRPNRLAAAFARRHHKALLANSDAHMLGTFGHGYSLISARKSASDIVAAIRAGRVRAVSKPLSIARWLAIACMLLSAPLRRMLARFIKRKRR